VDECKPLHAGIKRSPEEKWLTLIDKEGKSANGEGTPYGEILVRAYLDEEYFEHLHGGDARGEVGRGLHSFTFQLNLSRFCPTSTCPPVY